MRSKHVNLLKGARLVRTVNQEKDKPLKNNQMQKVRRNLTACLAVVDDIEDFVASLLENTHKRRKIGTY